MKTTYILTEINLGMGNSCSSLSLNIGALGEHWRRKGGKEEGEGAASRKGTDWKVKKKLWGGEMGVQIPWDIWASRSLHEL